MMNEIAIRVENLSKMYRIGRAQQRHDTLRDALVAAVRAPLERLRRDSHGYDDAKDTIWALKDVSFNVKRGEVVGIIGRNGAGKTTLLKVLCRITEPTEGRAVINGRVGSLLEVGTGFHPELTGRENIYLNGAILGMKRAEIERKFDEIVAFAEIEKFMDTPVKRYSSGMYVRLAFAVAAHLEPEILLVDEVLAVGDAAFNKKCLGKMGDVAREGRTVLFVSHNMAAVENLCSKAVLLENGQITSVGDVSHVVQWYLSQICAKETPLMNKSGPATLCLSISKESGEQGNVVRCGEKLVFVVGLSVERPINKAGIGVGITNMLGERVITFHSHYQYSEAWHVNSKCTCAIEWPENLLCPGNYLLVAALYDGNQLVASWENIGGLTVVASDYFGTGKLPDYSHQGYILARSHWEINTDS